MKRGNYQYLDWKQASNTNFELHSPIGHSWQDNERRLEIVWMECKPAPESLMKLITCNCQRALCGDDFQCRILSLECTDLCKCTGNCENAQYCENEKDDEETAMVDNKGTMIQIMMMEMMSISRMEKIWNDLSMTLIILFHGVLWLSVFA